MISKVEGVVNNKWKDNMPEITEIGEVIWESQANMAITDIEQKIESLYKRIDWMF